MPPTSTASRTRLLIEAKLAKGQQLDALVKRERAAGKSWHKIAVLVASQTDVTVTSETLRNWFGPKAGQPTAS